MLGDTYLFIDSGYLREVYRDQFEPLFVDSYQIDYSALMATFRATRAYLYDCLDNQKQSCESEADFEARIQRQEALFEEIDHFAADFVATGPCRRSDGRAQIFRVRVVFAL